MTLGVPIGLPAPPRGSQFPFAGVFELAGSAFAALGWRDPVTPQQLRGGPVAGASRVDTAVTRAHGGNGRKPAQVPGANRVYEPPAQPEVQEWSTPPRTEGYVAGKSRWREDLSSETTDIFANADGSFTQWVHQNPVNYTGVDGVLRPIETRWSQGADGVWQVAGAPVPVRLGGPASGVRGALAGEPDLASANAEPDAAGPAAAGGVDELVSVTLPGGHTVSYGLDGATPVAPVVVGEKATFVRLLPYTDIEIVTNGRGAKETIVLHSAQAASEWVFPLDLGGLSAEVDADGSVLLRDADGEPVGMIPAGYMQDSQLQPDGDLTTSQAVSYELITLDDGRTGLKVSADRAWLDDPARSWPVRVDPTVKTFGTSGDVYIDTDSGTGSGSQDGTSVATGQYGKWIDGDFVGQHKARGFISAGNFDNVGLVGKKITKARLKLFLTWTSDCNHHLPVDIYEVTSSWSVNSLKIAGFPGPSLGRKMGSETITDHYPACTNSGGDRSTGEWHYFDLSTAVVNDWSVYGGFNYGVSLRAAENDPYSWKKFTSENYSTTLEPKFEITWEENAAPVMGQVYPPHGFQAATLQPELLVTASDDGWPNPLKYAFTVVDAETNATVASSGWLDSRSWQVPAGSLQWGRSYVWASQATDGLKTSPQSSWKAFSTTLRTPITSSLSQNSGGGFDPAIGNFTTQATDAKVAGVGPELSIQRFYNSRDPRTAGVFGAGWSSLLDADAFDRGDRVVVTYPTGQQVIFGKNGDGTFSPPSGRYATFRANPAGAGFELVDKNGTRYLFAQGLGDGRFGLSSVTDVSGRALRLEYADGKVSTLAGASGRTLSLMWTGDRVSAVSDQASRTWTYTYTGATLTKVCPPTSATECTQYEYGSNSLHPAAVQDARPRTYLRLADPVGSTSAPNAAVDSLTPATGTYSNVTLGVPGPLPGSAATAATFNGADSYVEIKGEGKVALDGQYQSVSLWFNTDSPSGGVLFGLQNTPVTETPYSFTPVLYVGTDGKLYGQRYTGSATDVMASGAAVNDGQWHHVVLAAEATGQKLYLDGVQVDSTSDTQVESKYEMHAYLGTGRWTGRPATSGDYGSFTGSIAEVGVFNSVLTGDQVTSMYATGSVASSPLTQVVRPSGQTAVTVDYDPVSGVVDTVTDTNAGTWSISDPQVQGSSMAHTSAVLAGAPVDYWRLDDGAGATQAANMVNGHGADYSNVTLGTAGPFEDASAADFNGTDSFGVADSPSIDTGASYSVSAWAKLDSKGANRVVVGGSDGDFKLPFMLRYGVTGDVWEFYVLSEYSANYVWQYLKSTENAKTGEWVHLVGVYDADADEMRLYVNGKLQGTRANTAAFTSDLPLQIGRRSDGGQPWDGAIAEVATFQRVLDAAQMKAMFDARDLAADAGAGKGVPAKTVSVTDPAGNEIGYVYDLQAGGRLVQRTDAAEAITRYGYDTAGFQRTVTDPNGNMVLQEHDERGNVLTHTTCQDRSESKCSTIYYEYELNESDPVDPINDKIETMRDGRSTGLDDNRYLTSYAYDSAGNQVSVTDPLGHVTTTQYSTAPEVTSSEPCQSAEGPEKAFDLRWEASADKFCSKVADIWLQAELPKTRAMSEIVVRHAGVREPVAHNTKDFDVLISTNGVYWSTVEQVRGNTESITTHQIDPPQQAKYMRLEVITPTSDGSAAARIYEIEGVAAPYGLPEKVVSPGGAVKTIEYTVGGDVARVADAAGLVTEFAYDQVGQATAKTVHADGGDLVTSFVYDGLGRVIEQSDPATVNRVTGATHTKVTSRVFDADGHITSATVADTTGGDASRTSSQGFNIRGQLAWQENAAGERTLYAYDAFGRVVSRTAADGVTTEFGYDPAGRLTTTTVKDWTGDPNNPVPAQDLLLESRAYDPGGRLATVTDAMGWQTRYTYTDNGLTATVTRHDPGSGASFVTEANEYDAAGNLLRQTTNNERTVTEYTVDAASRRTSETLDPADLDRTTTYAYSPDGQVVSTIISDGSGRHITDTLFDHAGRRLAETTMPDYTTPVGRWKLDGDITDAAGNSTATATNITWSSERDGSAGFDGVDSAIEMAPTIDSTRSFTVAAWVKLDSKGDFRTVIAGSNDESLPMFYLYYRDTTDEWEFIVTKGGSYNDEQAVSSLQPAAAGTWVHLAGVFDADTAQMRLYVNGALQGSRSDTKSFMDSQHPDYLLHIGSMANEYYPYPWHGSIDDVQLYQSALSDAQIGDLHSGAAPDADAQVIRTSYTYDNRGLVTSQTDPNGNTSYVEYDAAGLPVQTALPSITAEEYGVAAGSVVPISTVGFDTFGEPVQQKDPLGRITTTEYDAAGRQIKSTVPSYTPPGGTAITPSASTQYDAAGRVVKTIDPLLRETSYTYDQLGRAASVTAPDGGISTFEYTLVGQQSAVVDPTGVRAEATWDYLGRQLTATEAGTQAHTTSYDYLVDAGTDRVTAVSPDGVQSQTEYNRAGETERIVDGAGQITSYTFDFGGQPVRTTLPDGTYSSTGYDFAGRPVVGGSYDASGVLLASTSQSYDKASNVLSATDANGHTSTFDYDAAGLLRQVSQPFSAAELITTSFGYDAAGAATRFTDGRGHQWWTTFNSLGLPESMIEPATSAHPDETDRTFTTVYDAAGQVVQELSPGGVSVSHTYDAAGRLTLSTGTGAAATTADRSFGYDAAGRISSLSGSGGTNSLTWNDRGQLASVTGPSGDSSFAWTADGLLASRTDAAGTTSYGYDSAGRLGSVANPDTGVEASYSYNALSQVSQIIYGTDGNRRSFGYDDLHRLTSDTLSAPDASTIGSILYDYDLNENLTSKTTTGFAGAASNTYAYDRANRLTSWHAGTTTTDYAYDKAGNRVQAGSSTFTFDERNRLLESPSAGTSYAYTPRGMLASSTTGSVVLNTTSDAFGQTIEQFGTETQSSTYSYDGLGRAIQAGHAYTGLGNDLAEDSDAVYTRGPGGNLLGVSSAGQDWLAWTDRHTDVVAQFTADGTSLVGSATYDPYGSMLAESGMLGSLGYQSEWTDALTGRVNMHARWYDPATGRFDSRDTVTLSPVPASVNANRYAYANANPLAMVDPSGNAPLVSSEGNTKADQQAKQEYYKKEIKRIVKERRSQPKPPPPPPPQVVPDRNCQNPITFATAWWRDITSDSNNPADKGCGVKETLLDHPLWALAAANFDGAEATAGGIDQFSNGAFDGFEGSVTGLSDLAGHGAKCGLSDIQASCEVLDQTFSKEGLSKAWDNMVDTFRACMDGDMRACGSLSFDVVGVATGIGALIKIVASVAKIVGKVAKDLAEAAATIGTKTTKTIDETVTTPKPKDVTEPPPPTPTFRTPDPEAGPPPAKTPLSCRHSFDAATPVLLASGAAIAISEVEVGDEVLATDPETGETTGKPVAALHVNDDTDLAEVTIDDTETGQESVLHTTQHHPFWSATDKDWVYAGDLEPGDRLRDDEGKETQQVVAVKTWTGLQRMRDLTVNEIHTYYVVPEDTSTPVLVHNCGPDDGASAVASASPEHGLAVLYYYPQVRPSGHFSIEVTNGIDIAHMDLWPIDGIAIVRDYPNTWLAGVELQFELPNAAAAMKYMRDRRGPSGAYDTSNNCASFCTGALHAGGLDVPTGRASIGWFRRLQRETS